MNALVSLPRIPKAVSSALHSQKRAFLTAVREPTRRRASRALSAALASGTLSPLTVTHALSEGDIGIAKLMRRHAAPLRPMLPVAQSFTALCPEPFQPDEIAQAKNALRQLALAGLISAADINNLLSQNLDKTAAYAVLDVGFNRVADRVNQALANKGFADTITQRPLSVSISSQGVGVQCFDAFVVPCIANPNTDPGFLAAYDGAISHLAQHNTFICPLTNGLEEAEPYLAELIEDTRLKLGDITSPDDIPAGYFDEAENEYGYEDEYLRSNITAHIKHQILRDTISAFEHGTDALDAWYQTAPQAQVDLIQKLHKLADHAESAKVLPRTAYSLESDTYYPQVMFLDSNPVFLDMLCDRFSDMAYQEGIECAMIPYNPAQFLECFEDVLINVAVANLAQTLVINYEHSID